MRTVVCTGRGRIRFGFVSPEGQLRDVLVRDNTITYSAADIMARVTGGFTDYIPQYIGFLYGTDATPLLVDPASSRYHTWDGIKSNLASSIPGGGNIVVCPFSATPGISVDGSTVNYTGNAVTFGANSGSGAIYPLPLAAPYYASALVAGNYIYQAVLLSAVDTSAGVSYIPFSRVSLKDGGSYPTKPASLQLGLSWTITYL